MNAFHLGLTKPRGLIRLGAATNRRCTARRAQAETRTETSGAASDDEDDGTFSIGNVRYIRSDSRNFLSKDDLEGAAWDGGETGLEYDEEYEQYERELRAVTPKRAGKVKVRKIEGSARSSSRLQEFVEAYQLSGNMSPKPRETSPRVSRPAREPASPSHTHSANGAQAKAAARPPPAAPTEEAEPDVAEPDAEEDSSDAEEVPSLRKRAKDAALVASLGALIASGTFLGLFVTYPELIPDGGSVDPSARLADLSVAAGTAITSAGGAAISSANSAAKVAIANATPAAKVALSSAASAGKVALESAGTAAGYAASEVAARVPETLDRDTRVLLQGMAAFANVAATLWIANKVKRAGISAAINIRKLVVGGIFWGLVGYAGYLTVSTH